MAKTKAQLLAMTKDQCVSWAKAQGIVVREPTKVTQDEVIKLASVFKKLSS